MCFATRIKRSPPTIISVYGINPYFDIHFQKSNICNLLPIPRYPNAESMRSAEIPRSWKILFSFFKILKTLMKYIKLLIWMFEVVIQQEIAVPLSLDHYRYHSSKNLSLFNFQTADFTDARLVAILTNRKPYPYSLSQINALISKVWETHSDATLQFPTIQFQPIILVWNIFQYFGTLQSFSKCLIVTRSRKVSKLNGDIGTYRPFQ